MEAQLKAEFPADTPPDAIAATPSELNPALVAGLRELAAAVDQPVKVGFGGHGGFLARTGAGMRGDQRHERCSRRDLRKRELAIVDGGA